METGNRSLPTESAYYHPTLQNGNFGLSSSCSTEERLGHFSGLEGCVLSHPYSSQVKEISLTPFYGENVPVSSLAVRALPGSLCVFQSSESGDQTLPPYGNASTCISRRLAPTVSVSGHFSVSQRTTTENGFDSGICTKLGQIEAGSQSDVFLSGSSFQFSDGTDRPVFRQAPESANIDSENSISVCSTDPFSFGTNGVHGSTLAGRQSPQASPTVIYQGPLVSGRSVMGLSHFPGSLVQSGCLPMAEQGFPVCHGATISSSTRFFFLFTDASLVGRGAHMDDLSASGLWSSHWKEHHINVLELRAVWLALKSFRQVISDSHVLLSTDNMTVAAYLNKGEGGGRSRNLSFMATNLLDRCAKRHGSLTAKFVPGKLNVLADSLSRKGQIIHTEWTLHKGTLSQIFLFWEVPHIYLFATRLNNRLPIFISPLQDPLAWAMGAMSLSWEGMIAYAFPPIPCLMRVLLKMENETCLVILIAPCRESHPFFPVLLSLMVVPAVRLPIRKDLLIQPHSRLPHSKPEIYNLHAWLCCREASRRQAFLKRLPRESVPQSELPHSLSTTTVGTLGWIRVSSGRWIPSIHL